MEKSEKIARTLKTSAVTTRASTGTGNFVVKVVTQSIDNEDTERNRRIAERATRIAKNKAFQRSLPISICRDGKILEIYADEDVK